MDELLGIVTCTFNPAVDRVLEAPGFAVGKHVRARRIALFPAGKGVNVSRVLATLGRRSVVTGFVGRNELAMFEEHLERTGRGLAVSQFLVVRHRTRDNTTIIDPVNETETHVLDEGFPIQPDDVQRIASKLAMLSREGVALVFAGSLPPGLSADALLAMLQRSAEKGARLVVDLSEDALARVAGRQRVWLGKFNQEELAQAAGMDVEDDASFVRAAESLLTSRGGWVDVVLASRGADGAGLFTDAGAYLGKVGVHPGRILTSVGCGDALLAGVLHSYFTAGDWRQALLDGLAVATANAVVEEAGALQLEDVEEFRAMAIVEPVRA